MKAVSLSYCWRWHEGLGTQGVEEASHSTVSAPVTWKNKWRVLLTSKMFLIFYFRNCVHVSSEV